MKALKLIVIGIVLFLAIPMNSQIRVNVNIGTPPQWGPVENRDVQYYYLPDVEAYYDVPSAMFIYYNGSSWIRRAQLPAKYRNYDLYHGYKVVMNDYRGNAPYTYFKEYKMKYAKGYRGKAQKNFRDERSERENKKDKYYKEDNRGNQGSDRNNGNNGKGHGKNK